MKYLVVVIALVILVVGVVVIQESDVPLLRNDALRNNPRLRRMPSDEREWADFVRELNSQNVRLNAESFSGSSYGGFSVDPSITFKYINLETHVILWVSSSTLGTSDATDFTIGGLPASITPAVSSEVFVLAIDNSAKKMAKVSVLSGGSLTIELATVSGTDVLFSATAWTAGGSKGLVAGSTPIIYPL